MGIEQVLESSGKRAAQLRAKMNVRQESSRPISSYKKGDVITRVPSHWKNELTTKKMPIWAYSPAGYLHWAGLTPFSGIQTLTNPDVEQQKEELIRFGQATNLISGTGAVNPIIPQMGQGLQDIGFTFNQGGFNFPQLPSLPSLDDIKTPLLLLGVAIAGVYLLGKAIK